MRNLFLTSIIFSLFFLVSCQKESIINEDITYEQASVANKEIARLDEIACITSNGKAGIKCKPSIGKTCKKAHACEAVDDIGGIANLFTEEELNNWATVDLSSNEAYQLKMWELGRNYHPSEQE